MKLSRTLLTKTTNQWACRIVAITSDCKSLGLTTYEGSSPSMPTNLNGRVAQYLEALSVKREK